MINHAKQEKPPVTPSSRNACESLVSVLHKEARELLIALDELVHAIHDGEVVDSEALDKAEEILTKE